jgi:hypothetical protein
MTLKKNVLACSMLLSILANTSFAQTSCIEQYRQEIKNNTTVAQELLRMDYTGDILPYAGYVLGIKIFGTSNAALAGYIGLPLLLIGEHYIEDGVHDSRLKSVIRLINESRIILGLDQVLKPRTDIQEEVVVDAASRAQRRVQRKYNRGARRHNRELKRYNKSITNEKNKRERLFEQLMQNLSKTISFVDQVEVAGLIHEAEEKQLLCNSEIGTYGRDLELRSDYVEVDGPTKRERRKQKRHNKQVDKHNSNVRRTIEKLKFAIKSNLTDFIKEQLN